MDTPCRQATVCAVSENKVTVVFERPDACAACAAKNFCQQTGSAQNKIDIPTNNAQSYHVGQKVNLSIESKEAVLSIVLAFGLPLLLILLILFSALYLEMSETFAASLSLAALIPYYLLLYFFRRFLSQKIQIKLTAQ